jgi:acetyl esterase/lipase
MVMGRRDDVETAPMPIAAFAVAGLVEQLTLAVMSVPFRAPWRGSHSVGDNVGASVTRQVMRSFMGYSTALPTDEFRSIEVLLDDLCRVVMPPAVRALDVTMERTDVAGVPGIWYHPARGSRRSSRGTVLYLHGGGYVGTCPTMYAAFNAYIARSSGCSVFTPDYRLAPEFPFPAGLLDVATVLDQLLDDGLEPERFVLAGDSGGGGLALSLLNDVRTKHLPDPAALVLFSPEVGLGFTDPSVTENAGKDILPWNIPSAPYLHGVDPLDPRVDPFSDDLSDYPPTFVAFGDDEMFRDAIRKFIERLGEVGVPTTSFEEPGMFHVFPFLMPWADASRRVFADVGRFIVDHLPE